MFHYFTDIGSSLLSSSPDSVVLQPKIPHAPSMVSLATLEASEPVEPQAQALPAEEAAQGSISTMTYVRYFLAGAGLPLLLCTAAIFVTGEASVACADIVM